jgi:hypothetical protein
MHNGQPQWTVCDHAYQGDYYLVTANIFSRKDAASTNPRGIPYAPFVDKVEDYVTSRADVETTLKSFQEMISYVVSSHTELKVDLIR